LSIFGGAKAPAGQQARRLGDPIGWYSFVGFGASEAPGNA